MGFDYQKNKDGDGHDNMWTSYSDLFMGLSFVFLLLYVTSSLRTGTNGIQQQVQMNKVAMENEDLKNQLKVYNSLKKDYLETEATKDDEKMYQELLGKLDLLQDEAKTEKEKLEAAANDNAKKETALNKYQQMVRNVMNANLVAKSRIKKRNTIIEEQDLEIGDLESTVAKKRAEVAASEKKISQMDEALENKMKELKWAYKSQKISQKKYNDQIEAAKQQHEEQLNVIKEQQDKKVAAIKEQFANERAQEKAAFEKQLNREKLSSADRAAKEAAFRAGVAQKERELSERISGLQGKLAGTEAQLAKTKTEMDARRNIAKEIQRGFAKAGIKAGVDGETGDITLDFGDHYFETGRSELKPEMAQVLHKALPIYAKSLMENKKIKDKISNVEIVGFASPTYQGRFIDPNSMSAEDKKAVEYNLDLSYQRARAIFKYVFDSSKMTFNHQKEIRPLVKVSGKSFFEAAKISRDVAAANAKDFCKKYDCKKSQRVLIKFTIDQKK